MFKVENTGTTAWRKIVDESGVHIANLDETYNGDWSLSKRNSRTPLLEEPFGTANKAAIWLWKNRSDLGEPFSNYPDDKKVSKKIEIAPVEIIEVDNGDDLFFGFKGIKK